MINIPKASKDLSAALQNAVALIHKNQRFLVTGHSNPDGDAVGASLGMYHLLRSLGKDVVLFNVDSIPFNFKFLEGADAFTSTLSPNAQFDVTCLLDCHERSRAGDNFPKKGWGEQLLIIDHHRLKETSADVMVHDINASATGELVYRLAKILNVKIEQPLAEALYTSIVTDTGGFRYSSTSPTALSVAANLVADGVDVWKITSAVYESNPFERLKLLGEVLQTLEMSSCKRLALLKITREMLNKTGAEEGMLDGFINHARSIRGVEVAAQLREIDENSYRVSFRSRGTVDVSEIAMLFGGGGHHNAAGCTINGSSKEVCLQLYQALTHVLDGLESPNF